ncbi:MAG: hypothetical protein IT273_14735 [Chitinophagales bacterium]|nr:hypothetical protein [Chitinophagales bacterium]
MMSNNIRNTTTTTHLEENGAANLLSRLFGTKKIAAESGEVTNCEPCLPNANAADAMSDKTIMRPTKTHTKIVGAKQETIMRNDNHRSDNKRNVSINWIGGEQKRTERKEIETRTYTEKYERKVNVDTTDLFGVLQSAIGAAGNIAAPIAKGLGESAAHLSGGIANVASGVPNMYIASLRFVEVITAPITSWTADKVLEMTNLVIDKGITLAINVLILGLSCLLIILIAVGCYNGEITLF